MLFTFSQPCKSKELNKLIYFLRYCLGGVRRLVIFIRMDVGEDPYSRKNLHIMVMVVVVRKKACSDIVGKSLSGFVAG